MTLEELNKKYRYKYDFKWYDTWTGLDDNFEGDCEDYCITLKREFKEFKEWEYWYCKLQGNGHCILVKDGEVIDCNIRRVVSVDDYEHIFKPTDMNKYNKLLVACKLFIGRIFKVFR